MALNRVIWLVHDSETRDPCDSESELKSQTSESSCRYQAAVPRCVSRLLANSTWNGGQGRWRHGWRAGAAGPTSDVRHQPAGEVYQQLDIGHTNTILWLIFSEALVVQWYREPCCVLEIMGSDPKVMIVFCFCTYWLQRYPRLYWDIQGCIEIYLEVLRHPSTYELTLY